MLHSVRIEPPPAAWRELFSSQRPDATILGRLASEWCSLTRRELLACDHQRLIATGHQAGFWHPGILAKYFALDAAGESLGAEALVEVVVDQDVNDLRSIRVPVIDAEDVLTARELTWSQWPGEEHAGPTGAQPPMLVDPHAWRLEAGERLALPQLESRCRAMGQALGLLRRCESRAMQAALAAGLLHEVRFANQALPRLTPREPVIPARPRYLVTASSLTSTTLWGALMDRMRDEPRGAWEAYNRAAAAHPNAGVAALERRASGGCEIPCWLITDDGERHRAFEHDLRRSGALLWPRALLMTAVVRLALCDLFIHGAGGYEYDRITEQWLGEWLGGALAPRAMVTATMTLDFDRRPADERDLARARWMTHHLPFNIDRFLDDLAPKRQREAILREIESLPRGSAPRRAAFDRMRSLQRDLVRVHQALLDEAREALRLTQRRVEEVSLINDRTWAFPLHDHAALERLRESIERRFERR